MTVGSGDLAFLENFGVPARWRWIDIGMWAIVIVRLLSCQGG
jgi:hypothetical protein